MKKLLCLLLATISMLALLACNGAGGDTNMHKIMQAALKEKTITSSDVYEYSSLPEAPKDNQGNYLNQDYEYTYALISSGYYKHYVLFSARHIVVEENEYFIDMQIKIKWNAEDNTVVVDTQGSNVLLWDTSKNKWKSSFGVEFKGVTYDMNAYYNDGDFDKEDAVYTASDEVKNLLAQYFPTAEVGVKFMIERISDLLDDAFDGLNEVYTKKGYPIR